MLPQLRHVLVLTVLSLTPLVSSQASILPAQAGNGFPQCGFSCTQLTSAAASCQADPSGQQAIITSCFCQSALLTSLHTSPNGVCDAACTNAGDLSSLMNWYNNFCASGGQASGQTPTTTSSGTNPTGTSTTAVSTATASTSPTRRPGGAAAPQSWWAGHYRWIVMLIVLIIVFTLLIILGVWLKRRHRMRRHHPNQQRAATPPPPFMSERKPPPAVATSNPNPSQLSISSTTRTGTMHSSKLPSLTARTRAGSLLSSKTRDFSNHSNASRGDMREVWGPHQHMAATRGWEYTPEGVVERESQSRAGTSSSNNNNNAHNTMSGGIRKSPLSPEIKEIDPAAHPAMRGEVERDRHSANQASVSSPRSGATTPSGEPGRRKLQRRESGSNQQHSFRTREDRSPR